MPQRRKTSKRVAKRRTRVNDARIRPYGGLVPARTRPLTTQNHMVRNLTTTINLSDAEAALTVGDVAASLATQGVTVSSYVIRRITLYGRLYYTENETNPSSFVYVPTNESWTFSGIPGVVEAKLAYVPPITSSGPFSSSQSGLSLIQTAWVAQATFEVQVVAVKSTFDPPPPPSPAPSVATRVERFNIVDPPLSSSRPFSRK